MLWIRIIGDFLEPDLDPHGNADEDIEQKSPKFD